MKKLAIIAVFVLLAAFGGLAAALPMLVSSESVRSRIVEQAQELTGRKLSFAGNPELTFNPFLGMELRDVVLADANGTEAVPLMKVEILRGKLDVFPAIFGRVRFGEFQLVRPEFNFVKESDGNTNWTFEEGKILKTLQAQTKVKDDGDSGEVPEKVEFGAFSLEDAVIKFDNALSGVTRNVNHLDASGNWDNSASTFEAKGEGVWENVPVSFDVSIKELLALISGGESAVKLNASSRSFALNFNGTVNTLSDVFLEGDAKLDVPSLTRMGQLLDIPLGSAMFPEALSMQGTMSGTLREFNFKDSKIELGSSVASGLLQIRRHENEGLHLTGTLAFDTLDLNPIVDRLSNTDTPSISSDLVVDLRISAKAVKIRETLADNLAMSFLARDGKVDADIGNIGLFGGQFQGNLGVEPVAEGLKITTSASLKNFQVDKLFSGMPEGSLSLTGVGSADLKLQSTVGMQQAWLNKLAGKASLEVSKGEINGLDLAALTGQFWAQKKHEENPVGPRPSLELGGKTPFSRLEANFQLNHGVASISSFEMKTNEQELEMKGKADLNRGGTALKVNLIGAPGNFDPSIVNRFFIGGTLANPVLTSQPAVPLPEVPANGPTEQNSGASTSPDQSGMLLEKDGNHQ